MLMPTNRRPRSASIFEARLALRNRTYDLLRFVSERVFGLAAIIVLLVVIVLNRFIPGAVRQNPDLPPELLDHIVYFLRGSKPALRNCCLVSKSWIPRTRKHLFANITFHRKVTVKAWMETFLDPLTSPSCHAKTLSIHNAQVSRVECVGSNGWIRGFSHVVHLFLDTQSTHTEELMTSLVPFHGFSPTVKSLRVNFVFLPPSRIFTLALSFPLLEDLIVSNSLELVTNNLDVPDLLPTPVHPPSLPAFTGSLELFTRRGMRSIAPRLLSLPDGIHFRKLRLRWICEEELLLAKALVEGCSDTLESLDIVHGAYSTST